MSPSDPVAASAPDRSPAAPLPPSLRIARSRVVPPPGTDGSWDAFAVHRASPDPFLAFRVVRDAAGEPRDLVCVWRNEASHRSDADDGIALEGHPLLEARPGPQVERFHRALLGVAATGTSVELNGEFVTPGGERRGYRLVAVPAGVDRLAVTVTDTTDRIGALRRLAESEERFRVLVESWAQATWETDAAGAQVTDSPSWRAYTGQRIEELLGFGWLEVVHPDDRERIHALWLRAVAARRPLNAEFRLRRADGEWRWTNVRAAPLLDEHGGIRTWVGMNIDVTAAREARESLRRSEERLRLAMQVAGFATFDLDLVEGRAHWSPTLRDLVGANADERVDGLDDFVHPDDRALVASAVAETRANGRPFRYEHRIVTVAGETRWVAVHGQTLFGRRDGRVVPVRSLGVVLDRSEQERVAELRDVFMGMLSHELRTPVTAIYGGAQMLLRHALPEPVQQEILGDIASESDRMRRLVENLLVLAKVERRAAVGLPEPVALGPIVQRAIADEQRRSSNARIVATLAHGLPAVIGDEAAVELAVGNLISNAVKYGPPDGTIEVEVMRRDEEVLALVRDEGPGLPAEDPGRIFDLFYRSDAARRAAAGAGIGLYVARALIEGIGGRIWASDRPEGGAEFGIALPVVPEPEGSGAPG